MDLLRNLLRSVVLRPAVLRRAGWLSVFALAMALCPHAYGVQSTLFGLDVRLSRFFTTTTDNFVGNFTVIGSNSDSVFALDFDETGTTLWGVNNTTLQYGTFDLTTGAFTAVGVVTGLGGGGATGLTCDVNGTWYLSSFLSGLGTELYVGDVTTGSFTLVGLMIPGIMIDISISSTGLMYGHSISDNGIFSIDPGTASSMFIGLHGYTTNFAQGMDFDWSDDTLYVALYTGGGTGQFAKINLATGVAFDQQSTASLNGEFEIAFRAPAPTGTGTQYCFGDGSGTACPCGNTGTAGAGCDNGTGSGGGVLSGSGTASIGAADLVLHGAGLEPNALGLYYQGNNATNGGLGTVFGDGLRCAGGGVVRLQVRSANASGDSSTTANIAAVGGVAPGDLKRYQLWYRNSVFSLCGSNFNLTNGLELTWQP